MIVIGNDHAGLDLKNAIIEYFKEKNIEYKDVGTTSTESCDYPNFAVMASKAVLNGECKQGIICCGTGVGIAIAANKIHGIRCVCCSEPFSAKLSRQHNDTNMLALGSRVVGVELAKMIVDEFLNAEFEGGRHNYRLEIIKKIEEEQDY